MFEHMMAALRANYPLFAGDNIFWFMQKSHYFLHLARDVKPDEFARRCRTRTERREQAGADPELGVGGGTETVAIPFGYADVLAKLADPLARAARPDFLTGRFVESAQAQAERELGHVAKKDSVLAYCGDTAEFVELTPDGARALDALQNAGSLDELLDTIPAGDRAARANVTRFAAQLHRLGLLVKLDPTPA
jgi:hypothetical protein